MKTVVMGHGSGGGLTQEIIYLARSSFASSYLDGLDSAILPPGSGRIAFTTDSYVIRPIFFPGGDIGRIAVCGTVNDLSVVGAVPRFISCGLILEEGFPLESLERVLASMAKAAREAEVEIVTGDTKVVEKGHGDGIYINTAGIGFVPEGLDLSGKNIEEGDLVLVSGFLGDHAMTILNLRESLGFDDSLASDCAPLAGLAASLVASGGIRFMRDLTRGGLAAGLHELADLRGLSIELDEESLPVRDEVRALSEMLGIDALTMANEGKLLAIVGKSASENALAAMRSHPLGKRAAIVGRIAARSADRDSGKEFAAMVAMRTLTGGMRIVPKPAGEKLPRIC
ncbi:MAG: hydrogenase expression/formation protein HypE [Rectinemataceae bacterium]|jgi:hydrogenase expression/formation protein HypE